MKDEPDLVQSAGLLPGSEASRAGAATSISPNFLEDTTFLAGTFFNHFHADNQYRRGKYGCGGKELSEKWSTLSSSLSSNPYILIKINRWCVEIQPLLFFSFSLCGNYATKFCKGPWCESVLYPEFPYLESSPVIRARKKPSRSQSRPTGSFGPIVNLEEVSPAPGSPGSSSIDSRRGRILLHS